MEKEEINKLNKLSDENFLKKLVRLPKDNSLRKEYYNLRLKQFEEDPEDYNTYLNEVERVHAFKKYRTKLILDSYFDKNNSFSESFLVFYYNLDHRTVHNIIQKKLLIEFAGGDIYE